MSTPAHWTVHPYNGPNSGDALSKGSSLQETAANILSPPGGWLLSPAGDSLGGGSNCLKFAFPGQERANRGNQGGPRSLPGAWNPDRPRGCKKNC